MSEIQEKETCFHCIHCKQGPEGMRCESPKANMHEGEGLGNFGRGFYCYPKLYDNCDCGDFKSMEK